MGLSAWLPLWAHFWCFPLEGGKGWKQRLFCWNFQLPWALDCRWGALSPFQLPVIVPVFYPASKDNLDQRVYGQLLYRLVGESKVVFLGHVDCCFREELWFQLWGRRNLAAVVCFEEDGVRDWRAGKGSRGPGSEAASWAFQCPALRSSAWRCPVQSHFLTLCGMFYEPHS